MLARKSMLIFFTRIFTAIFSFISLYFIAHYMGPTPLGIIGYANGLVGLFASSMGFDTAHYKRVSEGKDLGKCVGTYFMIKIILTIFLITIIVGGIFIWKFFLGGGFENRTHEIVIYVVLATNIILNLSSIMLATFGARKETAKQQIPSLLAPFVRMPIIVFVAVTSLSVIFLAGAYLIGAIVIFFISLILFHGYPIGRPSREYFKSYTAFALPAAIGEFVMIFSTGIDRVMIKHFFSFEEVGFYAAAFQMVSLFMIIPHAIGTLLIPTISEYHSKKDFENIKRVVLTSDRYLTMLILPITVLIFIFSKPIVLIILGEKFLPSANILILLFFMIFLAATIRPYESLILGINKPGIVGKINLFSCIMNVLFNVVFIPKELGGIKLFGLGAVGAALATLIAWIIRWMLFHMFSYKLTKIKPYSRILLHFIAGILMGIVLYIAKHAIVYHLIYIIPLSLFGIGCYFGILYLMKEFKKDDFYYLLDVVNPKKMAKYMKKEIKKS